MRVDLKAVAERCRSLKVLFKANFAQDSTLPGGCFLNCVHVRLQEKEVKVFPTCCQINHSIEPPFEVLACLTELLAGGRPGFICLLYPVMEVASLRLGFPVCEWKVTNLINSLLPDYSATFWPRAKGRGGTYAMYGHTVTRQAFMVKCSRDHQAVVVGEREVTTKPPSCFVYRSGTIVTSNFNSSVHRHLAGVLSAHKAQITTASHPTTSRLHPLKDKVKTTPYRNVLPPKDEKWRQKSEEASRTSQSDL